MIKLYKWNRNRCNWPFDYCIMCSIFLWQQRHQINNVENPFIRSRHNLDLNKFDYILDFLVCRCETSETVQRHTHTPFSLSIRAFIIFFPQRKIDIFEDATCRYTQKISTLFVEQMISNRFPALFIRTEISQPSRDWSIKSDPFITFFMRCVFSLSPSLSLGN